MKQPAWDRSMMHRGVPGTNFTSAEGQYKSASTARSYSLLIILPGNLLFSHFFPRKSPFFTPLERSNRATSSQQPFVTNSRQAHQHEVHSTRSGRGRHGRQLQRRHQPRPSSGRPFYLRLRTWRKPGDRHCNSDSFCPGWTACLRSHSYQRSPGA